MQKIGFFGGCFNPPTYAHLYFANQAIKELELDKVVFVPVGNFYEKSDLIDIKQRLEMLRLICNYNEQLEVSELETKIRKRLYAIDIFRILQKQYRNDDIYYMMGADNLKNIKDWKNSKELITNFKYIILERNNEDLANQILEEENFKGYKENFTIITNNIYNNVSSTMVRNAIKNNEDITQYIPKEIAFYIEKNNLYNKEY